MKKIRVHVSEIKNNLYAKIPEVIADILKIHNGDDIEISIHQNDKINQEQLWDVHPEDINSITFNILFLLSVEHFNISKFSLIFS